MAYILGMTTVTQHLRSIPTGPAASAPTPGLATLAQKLATSSVARVASPFAVRGAVDGLAPTAAMAASRALRSSPIEDVRFEAQLRQSLLKQQLIGSAMIAIRAARAEGRALTATESQYVRHAERAVSQGASLAAPIGVGVGGAGVRPYQTQISLADVGPGHLDVTLRDARMLRGLVVHHEHIDRESLDVAPYRMISPEDNARICLHAAGQVPVTVYYGRPSFQASVKAGAAEAPKTEAIAKAFEADPITPVNTLAAAAEAVFSHGTADVKVAMDGLTAKQAITLMRDVASKTPRGPSQFFSAAFNLNRPLVDDRQSPPVTVTDPRALARLVPELAAAGGWQKVTVDSASDKVPSTPLMELLGFEALVDFVHEAHRRGLETYISGGMRDQHFEDAVLSGVGGVGVGYSMHVRGAPHLVRRLADELGARPRSAAEEQLYTRAQAATTGALATQVQLVKDAQAAGLLADVKAAPNMVPDPFGGVVGPIDPEKIFASARVRDEAEASLGGQAARMLAEVDMAVARGGVPTGTDALQEALYQAIRQRDGGSFAGLLAQAKALGFGSQPGAALAVVGAAGGAAQAA